MAPNFADADDTDDASILDQQRTAAAKRPRIDTTTIPAARVRRFRRSVVAYIVDQDVPLSTVDNIWFRDICEQLDPTIAATMVGRSTVRAELLQMYEEYKDVIKQQLESSLTAIHLSFDLWTSPNQHAIIAIFAHFIDRQKHHQSRLLTLREHTGDHSGINIARTVREVVDDWCINPRRTAIVSDNISSNDTCLQSFYSQLNFNMSPRDIRARRMRCYGHILNLVARAFLFGSDNPFDDEDDVDDDLRIWGSEGAIGKLHYIVKFIRKTPQRRERFKQLARELEDGDQYRLSERSTAELEVIQNNNTRWNSTYLMIQRAVKKQAEIQAYIFEVQQDPSPSRRLPRQYELTYDDWHILTEIMHILERFYKLTLRTQGWGKDDGHGRLWEVTITMEWLLEGLEGWRAHYDDDAMNLAAEEAAIEQTSSASPPAIQEPISQSSLQPNRINGRPARARQPPAWLNDSIVESPVRPMRQRNTASRFDESALPEHTRRDYVSIVPRISLRDRLTDKNRLLIRQGIDRAWLKLNDYYTKLKESPLYAAAVILHPKYNLRYLEDNWERREWIQAAKDALKIYVDRWYAATEAVEPQTPGPAEPPRPRTSSEGDDLDDFISSRGPRPDQQDTLEAELDRYFALGQQAVDDVIQWWLDHTPSFPRLAQLALDVFAIPAMAAECERAFSIAKLSLSSQRHSMLPELLNVIQCLKNWLRHGGLAARIRGQRM